MARLNDAMKSLLRIDPSMTSTAILSKALAWAVTLSAAAWVVIGLVSLRFELGGGLDDVFYTQLIIAGIFGIGIANAFVMGAGGFGGRDGAALLSKTPILWALLAIAGMLMLIWQVWADFTAGPNETLKTMYSLLGVGLCGTYAGFVTLPVIERIHRPLRWAMHALTVILAAEIVEALWRENPLSGVDAGGRFAQGGIYVAFALAVYTGIAFVAARAKISPTRALVIYAALGLVGFAFVLASLWDALDAGPLRFAFGASLLLAISSVALALMHHYAHGIPNPWAAAKRMAAA